MPRFASGIYMTQMAGSALLTVRDIVRARALQSPDSPALVAPGCTDLTYGRLMTQVEYVGSVLRASGLGQRARIGLVIPTGAELAVAFLAVTAHGGCAPLRPDFRAAEYEAYFADLRLDAVILQPNDDSAPMSAANSLGIPIMCLRPDPDSEAGSFSLLPVDSGGGAVAEATYPLAQDLAVVMMTSGTTAQPKVVPLTHANLYSSAVNTSRALQLTSSDRCLNTAVLYHIHGLSMVLASLLSGASAVCPRTFAARHFFECLDQCRPTWYVGGPAVHRAILLAAKSPEHANIIARRPLRFIRSGSSSLPTDTLRGLEGVFGAPVVQAYGLTEAGPLIACNPLPPGARKANSVGLPAGTEVRVIDDTGAWLPRGRQGEIVARGPNIMAGYENDGDANEDAFIRGWFRTGDLGYLDDEGYLFITGRTKELINRGGQKVSPYEVEAVLASHPDVEQAVVFAMPHETLGEDVAAAVVLRAGAATTPGHLALHARWHLADFKVPRAILILTTIPLGPAGKVQRVTLAEHLGLTSVRYPHSMHTIPLTVTERRLTKIWEKVLGVEDIGITDDFYLLGGNSLQALEMLERASSDFARSLPPATFFGEAAPTIQQMARALDYLQSADLDARGRMVAIRPVGRKGAFFYLAGDNSHYLMLSRLLDPDRPFFVLEPHNPGDLRGRLTIEGMARDHLRTLCAVQPYGPYLLGGYSAGGLIAFEMARQLRTQGHRVDLLVLVDVVARNAPFTWLRYGTGIGRTVGARRDDSFLSTRVQLLKGLRAIFILTRTSSEEKRARICAALTRPTMGPIQALRLSLTKAPANTGEKHGTSGEWLRAYGAAITAYIPGRYDGPITLLRAKEGSTRLVDPPSARWRFVASNVVTYDVPGTHESCVRAHIAAVAERIEACLDGVVETTDPE